MIDKIILIDNVFDDLTNQIIINNLKKQKSWTIDTDTSFSHSNELEEKYSDKGMILTSYGHGISEYMENHNQKLNVYADLIGDKIIQMLSNEITFENIKVIRYLWNYYNKSSRGVYHVDSPLDNVCTIVYYLNTCDGYTEIDGTKVYSKSGSASIFDSNRYHYGTGPVKDKYRYNLNITFKYDSFKLK